jgi:hypothetical protein
MELSEAKAMLNLCVRGESRDHAFGDMEVFWTRDGEDVADGYFGGGTADVYIQGTTFHGSEAHELRRCGAVGVIGRNDETGPDEYIEGFTMPGLTKEAVRAELER